MECPPEMKEMMKVLYDLSSSETEVLYFLCDKEARVSEISENLNKDRSTVQRYLSKLRTAGLVKRESKVEEEKKGRYYIYRVPDKEEMKAKVKDKMDEWQEDKYKTLEEI